MTREVQLYVGDELGRYGFPDGHPFGPDRQDAFWKEAEKQGLPKRVDLREPATVERRAHAHQLGPVGVREAVLHHPLPRVRRVRPVLVHRADRVPGEGDEASRAPLADRLLDDAGAGLLAGPVPPEVGAPDRRVPGVGVQRPGEPRRQPCER